MRILAIDPGTRESAWVIWDGERVKECGKEANDLLVDYLLSVKVFNITHTVIEKVASYGMPVGEEVFETVFWSGRFAQVLASIDVPTARIVRQAVKLHLCHSNRAKDGNIRQALIDRFGAVGTKKSPGPLYGIKGDMWAALAVAVTHWDMQHAEQEGK